MNRGVVTFAFGGNRKYQEFARRLAITFKKFNPQEKICIITDSDDKSFLSLFDDIVKFNLNYGKAVEQKVYLDKYTPYDKTIFIDSDSLVLNNIEYFWEKFEGLKFSAIGRDYLYSGDKDVFLDVDNVLAEYELNQLPKFNGGVYYFDKSIIDNNFFTFCRSLIDTKKPLFSGRFRQNEIADEAIFSIGMSKFDYLLTDFNLRGMYTPINSKFGIQKNSNIYYIDKFNKKTNAFLRVNPDVLHFPGDWADDYAYKKIFYDLIGTDKPSFLDWFFSLYKGPKYKSAIKRIIINKYGS